MKPSNIITRITYLALNVEAKSRQTEEINFEVQPIEEVLRYTSVN